MMRITADKMMIIRVLTSSCADVVSVVVVVVVVVIVVVVVVVVVVVGENLHVFPSTATSTLTRDTS